MEKTKTKGLTFILGVSRLGANIASLLNEKNLDVVVVDNNPLAFNKLPDSFGGQQLLGDASDFQFLENNRLRDARRVIIVTDDDNKNILIAHMCSHLFGIPNVYVRLNDVTKGELLEGESVRAFYPFTLSKDNLLELLGDEK